MEEAVYTSGVGRKPSFIMSIDCNGSLFVRGKLHTSLYEVEERGQVLLFEYVNDVFFFLSFFLKNDKRKPEAATILIMLDSGRK